MLVHCFSLLLLWNDTASIASHPIDWCENTMHCIRRTYREENNNNNNLKAIIVTIQWQQLLKLSLFFLLFCFDSARVECIFIHFLCVNNSLCLLMFNLFAGPGTLCERCNDIASHMSHWKIYCERSFMALFFHHWLHTPTKVLNRSALLPLLYTIKLIYRIKHNNFFFFIIFWYFNHFSNYYCPLIRSFFLFFSSSSFEKLLYINFDITMTMFTAFVWFSVFSLLSCSIS